MKSKVVILLVIICSFCKISTAQVRDEAAENFKSDKYSLGVGIGLATMWGDLNQHTLSPGFRLGIGRHITKSLIVGFESYFGQLQSSEATNSWSRGLKTTATYQAIDINGKTSLGQLFQYTESTIGKALSAMYIGLGVGMINVKTDVQYEYIKVPNFKQRYVQDHDFQPFLSLNIGFRVHMKKFFGTKSTQLMINYNNNYTFSDYLDGINISSATAINKYKDVYSVLTIGFSFLLTKRNTEL